MDRLSGDQGLQESEPVRVLDHGYVELLSAMPVIYDSPDLDYGVLRAARPGELEVKRGRETDMKLLRYLWTADPQHSSPFEHGELWFEIKWPEVVARQMHTHRWMSKNVFSGRYHEYSATDYYIPDRWRRQSEKNHQGSDGFLNKDMSAEIQRTLERHVEVSHAIYKHLVDEGVAREMARLFLPAWSLYVVGIYKINLLSMINIIRQRTDSHAQWETQQYGYAFLHILRRVAPYTAEVVFGPTTADELDRVLGADEPAAGDPDPVVRKQGADDSCEYCNSEPDGYGLCERCGGCDEHCDGDCRTD